jgi:putative DNA primase/helicase
LTLPGTQLEPRDLEKFAACGIPPALATQAMLRRVTSAEGAALVGRNGGGDYAGVAFPYLWPGSDRPRDFRLRRDRPELEYDVAGRPKERGKYMAPPGRANMLYFVPGTLAEWLADTTLELIVTEGEKKCLSLWNLGWHGVADSSARLRFLPVGLSGVWNFRGTTGKAAGPDGSRRDVKGPISDLLRIAWDGRKVTIAFDVNVGRDESVQAARTMLTKELKKRGAKVFWMEWPTTVPDGVNGIDDFAGRVGPEAALELIAAAVSPGRAKRQATSATTEEGGAAARSRVEAPEFSEDALAERFTEWHGEDLRYVSAWGKWMQWGGACWAPDDTLRVFDRAREICRTAATERELKPAVAARVTSAATVAAVERLARADRRHAAVVDQWDRDAWILNTPGGLVDLRTGAMSAHRRDAYCTKITAVAPGGACPLWDTFLQRITDDDAELQAFLGRMVGYCLTADTREHALFFLYGTGANGKTVFGATVAGILGDYAKTAAIETFIASAAEHHPTDIAGLQGARLVTASETEDGRRWAEAKVKTLTGGDKVSARFMRQDFFEFQPVFKLMIAGNHKPGLRSVDEAIRRRLHLVPFTVTIPAAERDLTLRHKLRAEWPGILAWAIKHCLAWQIQGLQPPASVRDATDAYMAAEDAFTEWLEVRCVRVPNASGTAARLFADWKVWAEAAQEYVGSQKQFSQTLEEKGFRRMRDNHGARAFLGIGLRAAKAEAEI